MEHKSPSGPSQPREVCGRLPASPKSTTPASVSGGGKCFDLVTHVAQTRSGLQGEAPPGTPWAAWTLSFYSTRADGSILLG